MNIQKIFEELKSDNQNSALGIICRELESQGYTVEIDGIKVDSDGFFNGDNLEMEQKLGPLNLSLFRDNKLVQKFAVEFVEFHEIIFRRMLT